MQFDNLDPIEVVALSIKNSIQKQKWEDLIPALSAGETYLSDRKELMYEAFRHAGEYRFNESDYIGSILYFNKARKYNPTTIYIFDKIIESIGTIIKKEKERFIKSDLEKLISAIQMLVDYYDNSFPGAEKTRKTATDMISKLNYRILYIAPNEIEGKMTHRINIIVNAIEKDVPMEQVVIEISKFVADILKREKKKETDNTNNSNSTDSKR